MPYTLEDFTTDCGAVLGGTEPLGDKLPRIAANLGRLLANPEFVATTFAPGDTFDKKELYCDPVSGMRVLAHIHQGPKEGPPHSHGASWAVYGTASGVTGMKEWRRLNPDSEAGAVLELADHYELRPGETRGYGPHLIHSTIHPSRACVIRVTGTDLDVLPRYRFNRNRDRISQAPA